MNRICMLPASCLAIALLLPSLTATLHAQQAGDAAPTPSVAKTTGKKHRKKSTSTAPATTGGAAGTTGASGSAPDPINPSASPEPPTPTTQGPPPAPTTPSTNAPAPPR